ncbi:unnamed protein product, partial [Dicrocoelium dendriticum]
MAAPRINGQQALKKCHREVPYSSCNYIMRLVLSVLFNILIQAEFGRFMGISTLTVTAGLLTKPHFTGPTHVYFQKTGGIRRSRLRSFDPGVVQHSADNLESGLVFQDASLQQALEEDVQRSPRVDQSFTYSLKNAEQDPEVSLCESNEGSRGITCQAVPSVNKRREQDVRSTMLELFKRRILHQMNLRQVPAVNESAWDSIPSVIKKRLQIKVDTNNRILEDPLEENEEKEAIILLQIYPFALKKLPSLTFAVNLADAIDAGNVLSAWIHAETEGEFLDDTKLFFWEIIPPWPVPKSVQNVEDNQEDFDLYADPRKDSTQSLWNEPLEDVGENAAQLEVSQSQSFKVLQPVIAKATLPGSSGSYENVISVDITARLIHWIRHGKSHRYGTRMQPLIRHILIVCPTCSEENLRINPKKVVMEVRYRKELRRLRRSVGTPEAGLTNLCREDGHQFTCCTQPLSISFAEIGWDRWVMFPKKVEPNYCRGSCQ